VKTLAVAFAVLLAGCATTSRPTTTGNARLTELPNKGAEVSDWEQRCIKDAVDRSNDQIAQIEATHDAFTASRTQQAKDDRERELSDCRATADREKTELSASERMEYEDQAQQAHDRAALMMILTTSLTR